jgi:hypothetical protein
MLTRLIRILIVSAALAFPLSDFCTSVEQSYVTDFSTLKAKNVESSPYYLYCRYYSFQISFIYLRSPCETFKTRAVHVSRNVM